MLCSLRIKNLALMDAATLEFRAGFTVVTGETGAGKSILLGAFSLLAGNRAPKTIIRKGTDACEVEAFLHFTATGPVDAVLAHLGLPACEEGQLILRRSISATKPGRIHINGAAATLTQLESLGEAWIDFHGPGEPQKLFHERHQLELLDLSAGPAHLASLARYREDYGAWRAMLRNIEAIRSQERMSEDEISFVQSQLERMGTLDLSVEGITTLERDFKKITSARELRELFTQMDSQLGDEGIAGKLPIALRTAREIAVLDDAAVELEKRISALAIELADIQSDYSRLGDDAGNDDPTALGNITARMNQWLELRRKYGPTPEAVRAKRDALACKLALQGDIAGTLEKASANAAKAEAGLRDHAAALRKARTEAAATLANAATLMLAKLGFKKADLRIQISAATQLDESGDSDCQFLFLPNTGQDALPLNKIASSGEMARVMLALKTVLAGVDQTPILVFDEVDANVGGEIGAQVGRELALLARRHQVFCVTHLPQVAAQGHQHLEVRKNQTEDATTVSIHDIHDTPGTREQELARMLGDRQSASALTHARELLSRQARV